jgi:hypothetical protein
MKSRLAILSMLVFGMLLSTTGAGLAVTGAVSKNDAATAQYKGNDTGGDVLGEDNSKSPSGVAGDNAGNSGTPSSGLQPTRQVENGSGSNQLPFTGFLAIPVLLGGVALLSAGLVLRRRAGDDQRS